MTQGFTPLTRLPSKLAVAGRRVGKQGPTYTQCYRAVLDGAIPAEKIGREWHVADPDMPAIERAFGLTEMAAQATVSAPAALAAA